MAHSDRTKKVRIGTAPCPLCRTIIPVKKTEGGKLSAPCYECEVPLYINEGTRAHTIFMATVTLEATQRPAANDDGKKPAAAAASSSSSATPPKMPWMR